MKKVISSFLALVMLLSIGATAQFSAFADLTNGKFIYQIVGNNAVITGYSYDYSGRNTDTNLVVPAQISGYPVIAVGEWAFSSFANLQSITISEGITTLADDAFYNCANLTNVTLPSTLTKIGEYAFYKAGKLSSLTIPNAVTQIGRYAFGYCSSLTAITIPEKVTFIGNNAFNSCYNLNTINFNAINCSANDEYGSYAFQEAGLYSTLNLKVTIGSKVTKIPSGLFQYCEKLKSIAIPASVKSIESYAFYRTSLTSVTIPATVTSIGKSAFNSISTLNSITVLGSNTKIGDYAFAYDATVYCNAGSTTAAYCKNNYITYKYIVSTVSGLKVSTRNTTSLKLTWNKQGDAAGYQIQQYKNNKWSTVSTLTSNTNTYTVSSLKAGTTYQLRVRSYRKISGTTYYGAWSGTLTTPTKPSTPTLSSLSSGSKKLTAKWKKVNNCTGYQIQYSTSSKFSNAKSVTVSKNSTTSKTISKLTGKKKYFVRVRTYKTVNGTKYYSAWSKSKSVTTKK